MICVCALISLYEEEGSGLFANTISNLFLDEGKNSLVGYRVCLGESIPIVVGSSTLEMVALSLYYCSMDGHAGCFLW